jgi:hypothetical protein
LRASVGRGYFYLGFFFEFYFAPDPIQSCANRAQTFDRFEPNGVCRTLPVTRHHAIQTDWLEPQDQRDNRFYRPVPGHAIRRSLIRIDNGRSEKRGHTFSLSISCIYNTDTDWQLLVCSQCLIWQN